MSIINLSPIGLIVSERSEVKDDYWGNVVSRIVFVDGEVPVDLKGCSHLTVVFLMNQVKPEKVIYDARHPRNDISLPKTGILAQRGKNRPNKLGLSYAEIIKVTGDSIYLRGLDAIDVTPVIFVAPVLSGLMPPSEAVEEPSWLPPLMKQYYTSLKVAETMDSRLSALTPKDVVLSIEKFISLGCVEIKSEQSSSSSNKVLATLQLDSNIMPESALLGLHDYSHVIYICYASQAGSSDFSIGVFYGKIISINENQVKAEGLSDMENGCYQALDVKPYVKEFAPEFV